MVALGVHTALIKKRSSAAPSSESLMWNAAPAGNRRRRRRSVKKKILPVIRPGSSMANVIRVFRSSMLSPKRANTNTKEASHEAQRFLPSSSCSACRHRYGILVGARARPRRPVEISAIRSGKAAGKRYTSIRQYRGACRRPKSRRQTDNHRRAHGGRIPRSAYSERRLCPAGRIQRLFEEHPARPACGTLLSVPPSPGQFGLWHTLRKRLPQHEGARRRTSRLVPKALSHGRYQGFLIEMV